MPRSAQTTPHRGGAQRRARPNRARQQDRARRVRIAQERARTQRRRVLFASAAVATVLLLIVVMVVVRVATRRDPVAAGPGNGSAAAVVPALTVPPSILDAVARGSVTTVPVRVNSPGPVLTDGGKPLVLYVGGEYCPFCAAQRWGLIVALGRFGTFTGLGLARSAVDDVYPGTATLTFHGASYTSPYLAFAGVELATSQRQGDRYGPLDTLTAQQSQILATYDAPPYVPATAKGAVPFIDFGNRFIMSGSTFSPAVLAGLDHGQIAAALSSVDSQVGRSVLGSANAFTAVLCELTGGAPSTVCAGPAARAYQDLAHAPS